MVVEKAAGNAYKESSELIDKKSDRYFPPQTSQGEVLGAVEAEWLGNIEAADKDLIVNASQIKRFFEVLEADPTFTEQLLVNSHQAAARYNLQIDPEELRPLWDKNFDKGDGNTDALASSRLKRFQEFVDRFVPSQARRELLGIPSEPRFRAWWERQRARVDSMLRPGDPVLARTYPMAFELSKGCSVGCWFCAASAPRFEDIFAYHPENRELWRGVLQLMKNLLGDMAGAGFCYFATDPLDNPDYVKFCLDFHEILGAFPQTTTAQPTKSPSLTRSLLKASEKKGQRHNRFSILSLKMLREVHSEFSAEELAFVGLEFQNKEVEASQLKVRAGRARERAGKTESVYSKEDDLAYTSGSTVTGFLFNMVDKSVKLISPCIASDRWTEGYRIHAERTFSDVRDLGIVLEDIISHLQITITPKQPIRFRPDLKYESLPDGFQVSTKFKTLKFRNGAFASELGAIIHHSDKTAEEIAAVFDAWNIPQDKVFQVLNQLFASGILDEEPDINGSDTKVHGS